jgi:hypothetical protein
MRGLFTTTLLLTIAFSGISAHAELDEATRQKAIRAGFGLGCAVQDRDTARANAWAQTMMGYVGALASKDVQRASEFAAQVNGVIEKAIQRGGFDCKDFPRLP